PAADAPGLPVRRAAADLSGPGPVVPGPSGQRSCPADRTGPAAPRPGSANRRGRTFPEAGADLWQWSQLSLVSWFLPPWTVRCRIGPERLLVGFRTDADSGGNRHLAVESRLLGGSPVRD